MLKLAILAIALIVGTTPLTTSADTKLQERVNSDSGTDTIAVTDKTNWPVSVSQHASLFEDESGTLSIEQIAALPIDSKNGFDAAQNNLQPHLLKSIRWRQLNVSNAGTAPLPLRLALGPFNFKQVDFYVQKRKQAIRNLTNSTAWQHIHGSTSRLPTLAFSLQPEEQARIFIRVQSVTAPLVPKLYSEAAYQATENRASLWNGLLLGGLLTLSIGALILAAFARNIPLTLLGIVSFLATLYEASLRGYAKLYLWPQAPDWGNRLTYSLGYACLALFLLMCLSIGKHEKITLPGRRYFQLLALFELGMAIAAMTANPYIVGQISIYTTPLYALSLVVAAFSLIKQSTPSRKLMLLIAVFMLIHVILRSMEKLGFMPEFITWMGIDSVSNSPIIALLIFYTNIATIAAWIHHVGKQRAIDHKTLASWQAQEQQRLKQKVSRQTTALNQALQYADEKNRQKTEILGYIGHDLRTPIATIVGYANLLSNADSSQQTPYIRAIERSANYQLALIDELMDYAKTELKPLELTASPTAMKTLIQNVTQHAAVLSAEQENQFHYDISPSLPEILLLDGRRLQQVLLNLLSNAAKFTWCGTIHLGIKAQKNAARWQLHFTVTDSGLGIQRDEQESIFKAFEQFRPRRGSTGLGLFIAQSIVHNMGSELILASEPNKGTRFSFQIQADAVEDGAIVDDSAPERSPTLQTPLPHGAKTCLTTPPAHTRLELAMLARDGHVTDIETWLNQMTKAYPNCTDFFMEVANALQILDLSKIEALALSKAQ